MCRARSLYTTEFAVSSSALRRVGTRIAVVIDINREVGDAQRVAVEPFVGVSLARRSQPWRESLLDTVLKRDKLIVATYSTSPPLAYVDDNGKLVGFEIDMAHEIAKDLLGDPEKVEFVASSPWET